MRLAIFDNLANNGYVQAKVLRRLGHEVDLVLDPFDRYVMSDPRWEELDMALPTDELTNPELPAIELPPWIRRSPTLVPNRGYEWLRHRAVAAPQVYQHAYAAYHVAGWRGASAALDNAWTISTLSRYECVIAYGAGPAWSALARVPCIAETWGGDITMLPFYDTGDWEEHERVSVAGRRSSLRAQARLQRFGYAQAERILLTDPRFFPYADRLGLSAKCHFVGFVVDTEKYSPAPESALRTQLLDDPTDLLVFVPSRQDWVWKGSDQLFCGFALASAEHPRLRLVCAGWGADVDRSRSLIAALGISDRVTLLPFALSKARLLRYYRAADVVADQFTVGSYGSSALEAMSCGRPLVIALDRERFASRFAEFPPVMNASSPAEIAAALSALAESADLRSDVGSRARAWVQANHGCAVAERVYQLCEQVVSEARDH